MKTTCFAAGALTALLTLTGTVLAQGTGQEGIFAIHNDTEANVLTGFYTNDGSGWSDNWLDGDLDPGEVATAEFSDETGYCEQTFQAGWLDQDGGEVLDDPIDIDICEASNVYIGDNEIFFD
ncbi:hypothetical protein [Hoeflea sp.]|uniref:hypothetical protein n=1 Tax=Hoeflea sp. TaxID=1940281 RepID=UPI003B51802B